MSINSNSKSWHWMILGLIIIGIVVQFVSSPLSILLPIIIVGIVYYLYKRPPIWLQRLAYRNHRHIFYPRPAKKNKHRYPFRVIDGKKKKIH